MFAVYDNRLIVLACAFNLSATFTLHVHGLSLHSAGFYITPFA